MMKKPDEIELKKLEQIKSPKFVHEIYEDGSHRLSYFKPYFSYKGQVVDYKFPAILQFWDSAFAVFSEYWTGIFPTGKLLKITEASEELEKKEI